MKSLVRWMAVVCVLIASLSAEAQTNLIEQLEPLRPFLAGPWRGEFKNSTPDRPVVDVMHWERALNGQAIRILHAINEGAYGGESLVYWDAEKKAVAYQYFTTAGFRTAGTIKSEGKKLVTHEVVTGASGGVTEVRSTFELRDDGTILVKGEHLKDGAWQPGRETVYKKDASAKVVFR